MQTPEAICANCGSPKRLHQSVSPNSGEVAVWICPTSTFATKVATTVAVNVAKCSVCGGAGPTTVGPPDGAPAKWVCAKCSPSGMAQPT